MAQKNISFFVCDDESYLIMDHYLSESRWYRYEYAYNYYNINVNYIIPYKKVIMNTLLDILTQINRFLHHYK